jgi:hypothetical protein
MQLIRLIFFVCAIAIAVIDIRAQQPASSSGYITDSIPFNRVLDINPRSMQVKNDTVWEYSGICKVLKVSKYMRGNSLSPGSANRSGFAIHGNIFYDFLFRSYADTPYYQKDFRQHTVRTSISITVKEKYAFRLNTMIRISNSPYFRNYFDGGLQFDRNMFLSKMKQSAEKKIMESVANKTDLKMIETALAEQQKRYNNLRQPLSTPNLAQLLIEERQKRYYRELHPDVPEANAKEKLDSAAGKIDSALSRVENYVMQKQKELDSLQENISKLRHKADSLKNNLYKETALIKQKMHKASNARELKKVMTENNIPDEKAGKWEKAMSGIRSIGIGRSMVDYSELTVNNVSLTGINIEYNPRIYTAFAAGKIDYGFRDFIGRNTATNKQNLLIGRLGLGDKDRKAVILSVFTGRKYNYGSVLNDSVNSYINVTGYSIEGIVKKNENVGFSAEIAKSTRPVTGRLNDTKEKRNLFKFADRSNQAISIKAQTMIPETDTRLSGFFRKSGENFQSFSLFTYNTDQTAWLLKADQMLLKKRINLILMLRRNDFTNPFTEKTFKTSTVFTSAQLNVRVPKWPSVSMGYYPGSQLYIIDRERVRENVYYIMNGSIVHTYSLAGINMMSSAVYNYYSNKGTDSGFVNYSGNNYMISHSLLFRKLQLTGNYIHTDQQELSFFTLEANADYFPVAFFRIGAGSKYNKTEYGRTYWGGKAQVMLEIKKLGGLQLQYEKSFLPTIHQTLFPVEVGRVSWFKYF